MRNVTGNRMQRDKRIVVIQATIMVLMSAAGACSLLPDAGVEYYVIVVVFGWLLVTGAVSLVFPKVNPVFFSISVFAASLWAMLSASIFDLANSFSTEVVTGLGFVRMLISYQQMGPWVSFSLLAGLGIFIMAGHLALSNLHHLQNDYRTMQGKADETELLIAIRSNLSSILRTLLIGSIIVTFMAIVFKVLQNLFINAEEVNLEWAILLLGIPAILILTVQIYRMTVKKRSK